MGKEKKADRYYRFNMVKLLDDYFAFAKRFSCNDDGEITRDARKPVSICRLNKRDAALYSDIGFNYAIDTSISTH